MRTRFAAQKLSGLLEQFPAAVPPGGDGIEMMNPLIAAQLLQRDNLPQLGLSSKPPKMR